MKKIFLYSFILILLGACSNASNGRPTQRPVFSSKNLVYTAYSYIDLHERYDRQEIKELVGVDPVHTEWCAAFVNSILEQHNLPTSATVSDYPLTARSFLKWGEEVVIPKQGDIIIFPRGNQGWQGHVAFYVSTKVINGIEYYFVIGGNQDNMVSIEGYPAHKALSIRRMID